jgi:hypothetical protein
MGMHEGAGNAFLHFRYDRRLAVLVSRGGSPTCHCSLAATDM